MRFLIDAQLPPALARWIDARGHSAGHVATVLTPSAPDSAIVAHANENGAVIVTKDADFLTLAPPPPLILVVTGNSPNQALLELFDRQFDRAIDALE